MFFIHFLFSLFVPFAKHEFRLLHLQIVIYAVLSKINNAGKSAEDEFCMMRVG